MDFAYSPDEEAMRREVKAWLNEHLVGDVALLGQSTRFTPEDWKVRSTGARASVSRGPARTWPRS